MGGFDGHHRLNTVEKYNFDRNQWTMVAPMVSQRSDACATVLNSEQKPLIFVRDSFAILQACGYKGGRGIGGAGPQYIYRGSRAGYSPKLKTKVVFPLHGRGACRVYGVAQAWNVIKKKRSKKKTIV